MTNRSHSLQRSSPLVLCIVAPFLTLLCLNGCHTTAPPDPAAEQAITEAIGPDVIVMFRTEGGPLDESESADTLSLDEAVERAVTTDPGLQAALARVRIALADADQARLLPNPVLNIVLKWGAGTTVVEASLAQDFVAALQIPRRSSAADNRLREAAADAVTVALDIASDVQDAYVAAQATDRLIPILEMRLSLLQKVAGVARDRLEAGEGIRGDLTTLEAQRVELEVEIADARLRQRQERLRLARLIGEPSGAAAWTLDSWTTPVPRTEVESRWVELALAHRPEVQAITWQLAALGDEQALLRLQPWEGAQAGIDAERDGEWIAGPALTLPLPMFDMGQARRARLSAEQIEARHDLTLAKRKIVEEVRSAYEALAANAANLDRIRGELIPLQQQRRQQAEDAYRAGQTDVTPLFLAEQDLRSTQAKAIEIERATAIALIRLQRAVGGPGVIAATGVGSEGGEPITLESAAALRN